MSCSIRYQCRFSFFTTPGTSVMAKHVTCGWAQKKKKLAFLASFQVSRVNTCQMQDKFINRLQKLHASAIKCVIYMIKHCTINTCSHSFQTAASHSVPNSVLFYPNFIVPTFPSPAIACCVYLPACWLCARMAIGMNDCRYCVVLLCGVLNLSVSLVNFRSKWVVCQPKLSSVSKLSSVNWH